MNPIIQIYIDRLAQCDYNNALQELEIKHLKAENEELKKELEEFKEIKEAVEEDEKETEE